MFLFVGLRHTDQNFKMRRSEKIQIVIEPKTSKITITSQELLDDDMHT